MSPTEFPVALGQAYQSAGVVTSGATSLTAITNPGSAHTKGSYIELVASTEHASNGFWLMWSLPVVGDLLLLDIAIGAGGSEQNIIEDLSLSVGNRHGGYQAFFPISIPKGVRVSARAQYDNTANSVSVGLLLRKRSGSGFPTFSRGKSYGTDAATSSGTEIDPGAVANTKSGYTQLTASTEHLIRALWLLANTGGNTTLGTTIFKWAVDIAMGGAGSEQVIVPDVLLDGDDDGDMVSNVAHGPFYVHVPKGSRLSVRVQCSGTDATDRLIEVAVFGVG